MTTAEIALRTLASLARILNQAVADGQGYTRRKPDGSYHVHVHVLPHKPTEESADAAG